MLAFALTFASILRLGVAVYVPFSAVLAEGWTDYSLAYRCAYTMISSFQYR